VEQGLNQRRTPVAMVRGLLERMPDLQDTPVIAMTADDLQSNRQSTR
jgi:hypothetical protein